MFWGKRGDAPARQCDKIFTEDLKIDRVPKKLKLTEWPAEFSVYSRDKSKNFLLKKFFKILLPGHAHKQQR